MERTNHITTRIKTYRCRFLLRMVVAVLLLGAFAAPTLHAQSTPTTVTASLDRATVALGETVTLTVNVIGAEPTQPQMPQLDGFEILNSSSSTQININNGSVSLQSTYQYLLMPQRTGDLLIDGIPIVAGNQTYRTEPITVRVENAAAPTPTPPASSSPDPSPTPSSPPDPSPDPSPGEEMFVEAEIDNPTPYLGEQVTHTFRFYRAVTAFGQPRYEPPDFSGFWNQQADSEAEYMTQSGGTFYEVTELETVLFPTVTGERTIEPATISVPGSLLNASATLQTEPITLTVQPHPAPQPDRFSGAVGQLTITADVDTTQTAVNEPVLLRITLEGAGNIDAWLAPALPELSDWRVFDSTSDSVTQLRNGRLVGRRIYEYMLTPTRAGEFTVPPVAYSYFDPESEAYNTVATDPIVIAVEPGAVASTPTTVAPTAPQATAPAAANASNATAGEPSQPASNDQVPRDIAPLKPVPAELRGATPPLAENRLYQLAWLIPLLWLGAGYGWHWQKRRHNRLPQRKRSRQAYKRARQTLAQARKQPDDPSRAANRALLGYLGDKLDTPTIGLTHAKLAHYLHERGVSDDLTQRVQHLLRDSDALRFAPAGSAVSTANGTAEYLLDDTEQIITELEKALQQ